MCLAQGHNRVMPVRLEPATPQSQVKHSTTEPLRSLKTLSVSVYVCVGGGGGGGGGMHPCVCEY